MFVRAPGRQIRWFSKSGVRNVESVFHFKLIMCVHSSGGELEKSHARVVCVCPIVRVFVFVIDGIVVSITNLSNSRS